MSVSQKSDSPVSIHQKQRALSKKYIIWSEEACVHSAAGSCPTTTTTATTTSATTTAATARPSKLDRSRVHS